MKFQCDRCKTRYSISDEKVRGKILKIRCKTCSTIITVKDPTVITGEAPAVSASGSFGAIPQPGSYGALPSPTGSLPFLPAPPPPRPSRQDPPAEPTRVSPPPVADANEAAPPDEWFLSIDGEQEGPFTPAQARARVGRRSPDQEMFAWREDFTEWLPVEEVPLLAVHLPKAPPRMFADADGAEDEDDEPPQPVNVHDGMDFQFSDASRIVRMPLLAPAGPAKREGLPGLGARANGTAPRPSVSPPRGMDAEAIAAAAEAAPVREPSPRQSLQIPIASLSAEMAAQPQPRATSELSAAVTPHKHRRSFYIVTIGGAIVAAGILVGAITLVGRKAEEKRRAADDLVPTVVTDLYAKDSLVGATPAAPAPAPTGTTDRGGTRSAAGGSKATAAPKRPDVATPPPLAKNDPPRIGPASGKVDSFADEGPRVGPLTPDDVREAYLANEVMLKRCYERALKQEASLPVSKMDVKITIDASGSVSRIALPQETGLGSCVGTAIKNWRFRRSTGDFTTEFTVVFAKRG